MVPDHPVEVIREGLPLLMAKVMTVRSSLHNMPSTKSGTHYGSTKCHVQVSAWFLNLQSIRLT